MLTFCLHSLFRRYGWNFFHKVALPHPLRTLKALIASSRLDYSTTPILTSRNMPPQLLRETDSVTGVGFCLKPIAPPCPSGHANHNCLYLERLMYMEGGEVPVPCVDCVIREIGIMAFKAGSAFYIMTSARDILMDIYIPSLNQKRFTSGLFVLCRYSLRPFAVGLLSSGIHGLLLPYEHGDCTDYATWLKADRGTKNDRTAISEENRKHASNFLSCSTMPSPTHYMKQGNIFYPEQTNPHRE